MVIEIERCHKAIGQMLEFIQNTKSQSLKTSANRECVVVNLEKICRENNVDLLRCFYERDLE